MSKFRIVRLCEKFELKETMTKWFREKWHVPIDAYLESMDMRLEEA